ncbi:Nif11-like leader peptide family natural product precursor [Citrifermentans bemidjiense]|nr:Nif11-like leader peptide family natural product precursor [Citrifermentans bemidjiense]
MRKKISMLCVILVAFVANAAYSAEGDRCSPQIANNAAAASVCGPVCEKYGLVFAGNWSNDPHHPPVKACIDKGEGEAVCGCAATNDVEISPTVQTVDTATQLQIPIGMKKTCLQGPDSLYASQTCPVVNANGLDFWALSYVDNRVGMAIVAYDSAGKVVGLIEKTGARYIWDIAVDATKETISFRGQANKVVSLKWSDLFIPQMAKGNTTANYVIWPTSTSGQASWTNGVQNYGTAAPFGSGANQLLDPYIEHSAGKQLCADKKQPWSVYTYATIGSPYSTVTCILPPVPGQPTYNPAMNALLDAAVNDHSLMAALASAVSDAQLIAAAASKGYKITEADIAQSRGPVASSSSTVKRSLSAGSASCGGSGQEPCSQCTQETCVYWPFNFCCIKEYCECVQSSYSCNAGLSINPSGICTAPRTCLPNQICKDFVVFLEYNDNGTKDNRVCEQWLSYPNCAKGIPNAALSAYEIVFNKGKAYYKSTNTLVNTWTGSPSRETLYVIDARDNKIYLVNVDGRYIQVRGSANCIGQTIPEGDSTAACAKPRLTTHAGILMGSIAGLPSPNSEPGSTVQQTIKVIGAGTIQVINGDIQWITNDSGHFKPSQDNLKNSIAAFKAAGFPNFPPLGDCTYSFQPVAGKDGVYRQNAVDVSHCEL